MADKHAAEDSELPPAITLMGPTASGKTDLAMWLCERLPCEIISVDSALVYKGMDIGTAKPTRAELKKYPHRLVDIVDPAEPYSAARFRKDALRHMQEIHASGRIPLLVGGTMLYFKALIDGLADIPEIDPAIRKALETEAIDKGWPAMHAELAAVDPQLAETIHPNHSQRISRALEVWRQTGRSMSDWRAEQSDQPLPWRLCQLALLPDDRAELHARIDLRLQRMFDQGFIDEVKSLRSRSDLHLDLPSMRAVGYRQVWEYLDEVEAGGGDFANMQAKCAAATRQLAKRQLTWLRGWQGVQSLIVNSGNMPSNRALAVISDTLPEIAGL